MLESEIISPRRLLLSISGWMGTIAEIVSRGIPDSDNDIVTT